MNEKLRVGITSGDVNGIGLEVIIRTLAPKAMLNFCTPVIYANPKAVAYYRTALGAIIEPDEFETRVIASAEQLEEDTVNIINVWDEMPPITVGAINEVGGKAAIASLTAAVADLIAGHIDVLVTAPIQKQAMQMAGFAYPGHTEYLTEHLVAPNSTTPNQSLMLLVADTLRVATVTGHIPLKEVSEKLTKELVLQKITLLHNTLRTDFGIDKPRIAVLGLNPHAGDGGVIGHEEQTVILPAIVAAKAKGILAIGAYSADGFFGKSQHLQFDAVLGMFHDQVLVPFKLDTFGGGVNYTAGLPFIRTSPDHGTALDIAGKNVADESSFRTALFAAIDIHRNREAYAERNANPLVRSELQRERF